MEEEEEEEMGVPRGEGGRGWKETNVQLYISHSLAWQPTHLCLYGNVKASSLSFAVVWSGSKVRTSL